MSTTSFRELAHDIADLTGAPPPRMMEEGSPTLAPSALDEQPMYLVGLIGGKDVGKSALVNALVGREITPRTSHGPGTETVIAYAHQSQSAALTSLLDAEVPGQYRIVTHDVARLQRQVLLDLPDIDSHYAAHVDVTRRMLKHMLFPVWMQSVEKYADHRPRELLALVSAGNDSANFIFALNKADQIIAREGQAAADELRSDFAHRVASQLDLKDPPRVWLISAIHPDRYDLPALRALLADQRSEQSLGLSRKLAARQQDLSLADWVRRQDLDNRLAALERLERAAEEELAARIGVPLIESVIPRLLDDPAYRLALSDELMNQRVTRWPLVNIVHVLLGPLLSMLRLRLPIEQQRALAGPEELVAQHLATLPNTTSAAAPVTTLVQSAFASLQQSSPLISQLYADRKLWETLPAGSAESDLRQRLAATVERQRSVIRSRLDARNPVSALFRLLLTVGAVIWFPFAQPLLEAFLVEGTLKNLALLAVQLFGVTYLLKNVGFLAIYFVVLWLALKWNTQRRVDRALAAWKTTDTLDPALSLAGQVVEWTDALLDPVRATRARMAGLLARARRLLDALPARAA